MLSKQTKLQDTYPLMSYAKWLRLSAVSLLLGLLLVPVLSSVVSYHSGSSIIPGSFVAKVSAQPTNPPTQVTGNCPKGQCIIDNYINPLIVTLSALVGVAVTISIIVGGIQYAASSDDAQKVAAAKSRITKSLLTLLGFFFIFGFLNYIIPGGLL